MKLATTDAELHELERIENDARPSSATLKVPHLALRHLLLDHVALNTEVWRKHGALPETAP